MPTARELLEQADALMRRNRKRGKRKPGDPSTLADTRGIDRGTALAPTIILPDVAAPHADLISLDTLGDVPVLTDVVDVWAPAQAAVVAPAAVPAAALSASAEPLGDDETVVDHFIAVIAAKEGEASAAPRAAADSTAEREALVPAPRNDAEATAAASLAVAYAAEDGEGASAAPPSAVAEVSPALSSPPASADVPASRHAAAIAQVPLIDEEFILEIPPATKGEALAESDRPLAPDARMQAGASAPTLSPGSREWDALAEEIRMQVLQRLDLFADTGMRDRLGAHLRPIVDRASAQLVETINRELGELVRGYVAEAIEREIESWRRRSG